MDEFESTVGSLETKSGIGIGARIGMEIETRGRLGRRDPPQHMPPPEDRTWKPAATWQSGERNSQHGSQMGGVYNKKNKKKPNQGQGRRTWQNNQNYKKPYDWRDGPSNWRDAPDGRNK